MYVLYCMSHSSRAEVANYSMWVKCGPQPVSVLVSTISYGDPVGALSGISVYPSASSVYLLCPTPSFPGLRGSHLRVFSNCPTSSGGISIQETATQQAASSLTSHSSRDGQDALEEQSWVWSELSPGQRAKATIVATLPRQPLGELVLLPRMCAVDNQQHKLCPLPQQSGREG